LEFKIAKNKEMSIKIPGIQRQPRVIEFVKV